MRSHNRRLTPTGMSAEDDAFGQQFRNALSAARMEGEERVSSIRVVAYTQGFAAGYEAGYKAAKEQQ